MPVGISAAESFVCFGPGLRRQRWHRFTNARPQHVFAISWVPGDCLLLVKNESGLPANSAVPFNIPPVSSRATPKSRVQSPGCIDFTECAHEDRSDWCHAAHGLQARSAGIRALMRCPFPFTLDTGVSMSILRISGTALVLSFGTQFAQTARATEPPQAIVSPLMLKDLTELPGREMLMISVVYPPGAVEQIHRHDGYAYVYVLEGTIIEGVRGGKKVTLTPGQTFYEGPDDVHTVGRNASKTRPAKFLVVLVKKKGVDAVLPAQ